MKVSLLQMNVQHDKAANLRLAAQLIEQAVKLDQPDLVVLPECFTFYGGTLDEQRASAEPCPDGEAYEMLKRLARRHRIFIHGGSLNERHGDHIFNTTFIFNREGAEVCSYRKIHMFAITAPDGMVYDENHLYRAGDEVVTYDCEGVRVGCSICYDIRFPELYLELVRRGAQVIAIPSAFTLQTGKEHWEVLCRARAIETQCYILAPGHEGIYYENGAPLANYGHSMVVDPWGTVIARRALGNGIVSTRLDPDAVAAARSRIPLSQHRKLV